MERPRQAPVHCEAGIYYAHPMSWEVAPAHYHKQHYRWVHIPTSTSGTNTVYLFNPDEFHKLLEHWSRTNEWIYQAHRESDKQFEADQETARILTSELRET